VWKLDKLCQKSSKEADMIFTYSDVKNLLNSN
jgi:hypothetical protein